jgi:tetratricopeptide (TPR) repeat protein/tRNA A-37 threonylcarbamoyl transferase component Bud32
MSGPHNAPPTSLTHSIADPAVATGDAGGGTAAALPTSSERYLLAEEIARGGMGIIYLATDSVLGREVAVKLLHETYAPDSVAARRFADEARIAAQLQHPAIPPVHDLGTLPGGRPFLAMKLIKGQTLEALLAARSDPSAEPGRYVAAFEQVCQALAYAHAHDVIHRDLKPANVMVGAFGEVQVMDWGLAKVLNSRVPEMSDPEATTVGTQVGAPRDIDQPYTQAGNVLGTPAFMPPEQAVGAVGKVDRRSDVFGLGAILAVILTGRPPFTAASAETTRVKAAQGKVEECFARLDVCGAGPELVALCRRCLAPEPADRPADAGAVARAVAALRTAADERARRAELDKVRLEGIQAAAEARALERRKRRRLWLAAAALLVLATVSGLAAVLAVQRQANAELAAKNTALAEEQAKVEARFGTALKAIATFHTGVSEDALLKNDELTGLRTRLLKEAAGFYGELENLLARETDPRSKKLLAESFFQLGDLTEKIGEKKQALVVHRQALALRRELAAAPEADVEMRLDVARSLGAVAGLLRATGDQPGALAAYEEERDLAAALAAESPTDAVRRQLAAGHHGMGMSLSETSKPTEALQADEQARAIWQQLADANPAVTEFQSALAHCYSNIGLLRSRTGNPAEALEAFEQARAIRQRLAIANPTVTQFQNDLARSHNNIGFLLWQRGKPAEALKAFEQTRAISQALADAHLAVTEFQRTLALSHNNIGAMLILLGKPAEALKACEQALSIQQKLADGNPAATQFQYGLALSHNNIGLLLAQTGKLAEALKAHDQERAIMQKLAGTDPTSEDYQSQLAESHYRMGGLLARQGHFARAFASLNEGQALCQKLADAHPEVPRHLLLLGYSHAFRGKAHIRAGHPAEGAPDLRRALELWAQNKTGDGDDLFERARALALLAGLGSGAKSGVTPDEAKVFTDQAIAALRDAVQAGWNWPAELKEPDFDALRGRDDFKKLLTEFEAKAGPNAKPIE